MSSAKKFYALHPGYIEQKNEEWRLEHPDYMREQYQRQIRDDPIGHRIRRLLNTSRKAAERKGLEHSLDKQWCLDKFKHVCEATGLQFDLSSDGICEKRNPFAPSIDRIDNNKGYTIDNCQMVVYIYNISKNTFTNRDLYKMCTAFIRQHDHDVLPNK